MFLNKCDKDYRDNPNVTCIAKYILKMGSTEQEHDEAFINMLEATCKNNP